MLQTSLNIPDTNSVDQPTTDTSRLGSIQLNMLLNVFI